MASTASAAHSFGPRDFNLTLGSAEALADGGAGVTLDSNGRAIIMLPAAGLKLDELPNLQLALGQPFRGRDLVLFWETRATGKRVFRVRLPAGGQSLIDITLTPAQGWQGEVTVLGLGLLGQGGDQFEVLSMDLAPSPSDLPAFLSALVYWFEYSPWQPSSINAHTGSRLFQDWLGPTPVLMALAMALWLLLLTQRQRLPTRTQAPGALLLLAITGCWLLADLVWQRQALLRAMASLNQWGGLSHEQRWGQSRSGDLYRLAERAREMLAQTPATRVFLSAGSEYLAGTMAYHLTPLNTYWTREKLGLPEAAQMREGDHILAIKSPDVTFAQTGGMLRWGSHSVAAERLIENDIGQLYRVKAIR